MTALSFLIISLTFLYATETETVSAGSVDGIVFNDENKTLAYAHVALPELNKGTITRRDGTFSLDNVPVGEYRILISHVGYLTSRVGYGNTVGNSGFQVTYLHRRADKVGPLNFHLNDLNARWKLVMGQRSVLGIKMSIYDELSNATYVGLTQPMFESGLYDFKQLAPDDELDIRRYSASVSHDYFFSDHVHLRTTAYAYTTRRNWSRQDFDNQPAAGREYRRVAGNPDEPFGAIWFREGTGNRNREFEVVGFEPRISARFHLGEHRNELDAGFRLRPLPPAFRSTRIAC